MIIVKPSIDDGSSKKKKRLARFQLVLKPPRRGQPLKTRCQQLNLYCPHVSYNIELTKAAVSLSSAYTLCRNGQER